MSAAEKIDPELEAFRAEARGWLEKNFPPSLKGKGAMMMGEGGPETSADFARWKKAMGEKGWGVPTWPKKYGAGGLSQAQARVLQQEINRIGAFNPIGGMGVMMFGPTLLEFGSEEQKSKHVPGIVKGEVWWCQGYSEPGAGSDLASLRTQCIDKGDHFLVNGQKIWTSGAQYADMCFCLVRTDNTKKHEGISFLLIDMKSPGVTVRPIQTIDGSSEVNEVFFDDVKVPAENLVGKENKGWDYAKFLLGHERTGIARVGISKERIRRVKRLAALEQSGGRPLLDDQRFREKVAAVEIDIKALEMTQLRVLAAERTREKGKPDPASSILKIRGSEIQQATTELLM
ncbi:MAG TPA: acyl-CoA dehydrogenase family protein, partial [Rhizomicrobium sp.]|nr:acyl-CoA dehydrogenase family protein [Rhizomicrobium sp.]